MPTSSSSFKPEDVQLETKLQTYLSQSYPCNITSVEVTKDNVIIKGNKPSELPTIYLGEIAPYENVVEANKFSPSYPVTENNFTITVDRYLKQGDTTYDRLLSKWILLLRKRNRQDCFIRPLCRHHLSQSRTGTTKTTQ